MLYVGLSIVMMRMAKNSVGMGIVGLKDSPAIIFVGLLVISVIFAVLAEIVVMRAYISSRV